MRTDALPNFVKLYGRVLQQLSKGTYTFKILNNFEVKSFGTKKSILLTTLNGMGGSNTVLDYFFIIAGVICLQGGLAFVINNFRVKRELGDAQYLKWNKNNKSQGDPQTILSDSKI